MILSNVELQRALDSGRLVIRPGPQPRRPTEGQKCPYATHSVDLKLGAEISIPSSGPYTFDLMQPGSLSLFLSKNAEHHTIHPENGFTLHKGKFVLGLTQEFLSLPLAHAVNLESETCLAARIEGKSSLARCGILVHFTAPTVHPGFEGTLTLEIINLGPAPFTLRLGMPIAQLIVEEVRGIPFENRSQFQGQLSPEGKI